MLLSQSHKTTRHKKFILQKLNSNSDWVKKHRIANEYVDLSSYQICRHLDTHSESKS
jgi:hypothetical protein